MITPPGALLLMHTLNLVLVMMMKVAHEIWMISVTMEEEEVGAVVDDASH
jgi:hypothetical protein